MLLRCLLLFFLLSLPEALSAQASLFTKPDTAAISERRKKKIAITHIYRAHYDSVTGKLNGVIDTGRVNYDPYGRETARVYPVASGNYSCVFFFYDQEGRLVRQLFCTNDSAEGHIDTWTYDAKGRVATEKDYFRKSGVDELFRTRTFQYDSAGRVILETVLYATDSTQSKTETIHFKYTDHFTVRYTLHTGGDTFTIDSVFKRGGEYWSRMYVFETDYFSGQKVKKKGYAATIRTDTIRLNRTPTKRSIFLSETFGYESFREEDTLYTRLDNKIIQRREMLYIDDYVFSRKGEFEYFIRHNRKGQPIYRHSESYTYYP